jgi:hypothetical protein
LVGIQRCTTTRCPPPVEKGDVAAIPGAGTPTSSCCKSYRKPRGGPRGRSSPLPPVVRRLYAFTPNQHQQPPSCNTIPGEKPLAPPPSSRSTPRRICRCRTAQVRFCLATFRSTGGKGGGTAGARGWWLSALRCYPARSHRSGLLVEAMVNENTLCAPTYLSHYSSNELSTFNKKRIRCAKVATASRKFEITHTCTETS